MSRTRTAILIMLGSISLIFFIFAFFAVHLGIDNDPGWGRGRLLLLAAGIGMVLLCLLVVWGKKLEAALDPFFSHFFKLKLPGWLRQPSPYAMIPLLVGLAALASFSYLWLNTHGRIDNLSTRLRYIPMLSDAFRSGQLHLQEPPSEELLALENPYDPAQYTSVDALHDASLYQGRYYLYWGPVPALLLSLLPAQMDLGDIHVALFFAAVLALASGAVLLYIWRNFFPEIAWWFVLPGFVMLFWNTPLPFMFSATSIYEAVILGSQFFILMGFLSLLVGLSKPQPGYGWIILGGIFWVMAAGTRVTSTLAFLPLAAFAFWNTWKNAFWRRSHFLKSVVALGIPLAMGALALFWYNYARFGSIFESGMCLALSIVDMTTACPYLFSVKYVPANLFLHLFRPLSIEPDFPFFFLKWVNEVDFPFFLKLDEHYRFSDPIAGMVFTLPFSLLFGGIAALQTVLKWRETGFKEKFLLAGLLTAILLVWASLLTFFAPISRYLADFSILLTITAMIGFWKTIQSLEKRYFLRFVVIAVAVLLVFWGISVGFMTGISGLSRAFYEDNPALFNLLQGWFSAIGLGS